ncbi:TPA: glycogen branching protein, partial [Acinetobacter baumannii]
FVCFYFYENIFNGNLLLSIFLFMNFYNLLSKSYSLKNIG